MGSLKITIQVLDLSPKVTLEDLTIFFSYCGMVDSILLQRNRDHKKVAYVTFRQPYAYETALLLDGAAIVDHSVKILPLEDSTTVPAIDSIKYENLSSKREGILPAIQVTTQNVASEGIEMLHIAKTELEDNYKLLEKAGELNEYIINSSLWFSNIMKKALKH